MKNPVFEKLRNSIIVEIPEYAPNSVVIKTIINKHRGNISAISFDSGESLTGKLSMFDTFIEVIDGNAEVIIDDESNLLDTGQFITIPANSRNVIKANQRFKMLSTRIKRQAETAT